MLIASGVQVTNVSDNQVDTLDTVNTIELNIFHLTNTIPWIIYKQHKDYSTIEHPLTVILAYGWVNKNLDIIFSDVLTCETRILSFFNPTSLLIL